MRIHTFVLTMVGTVLLAGCSFPSPPSTSLAPITPTQAPASASLASLKDKTIGVLFAADMEADLDYPRRYHQQAVLSLKGRLLMREIREGYANSSQPERTLAAIQYALASRLVQVTFYGDQASPDNGNPDIIVVVHTYHRLLTPSSSDMRADVAADFFDRDYQYLGRAEGHQAASMPALWRHNQRTDQIISQLDRQQVM